jgi:hypothetical protein
MSSVFNSFAPLAEVHLPLSFDVKIFLNEETFLKIRIHHAT